MSARHWVFGIPFSLLLWDPDDVPPSGVGPFHYALGLRAVRERFGASGAVVVGMVNDMHPLLVDAAAPSGAVYAVEGEGDDAHLHQVADALARVPEIAELIAMLWDGHGGAVALPYDATYRAMAVDVLGEIAAKNPGSNADFWRWRYLRQYDLRISV